MSESSEESTDLGAIEAMIRAAGDHVVPSRDLRPRLIESVRRRRSSDRRRQLVTAVALPSVVFFAALTNRALDARDTLSEAAPRQRVARAMASYQAGSPESRIDRQFWGLADAFRHVQQQQAEAFSSQPISREDADSLDSDGIDAKNDRSERSE